MGDEADDPVVQSYDVFLQHSTDPGGSLYLLQSPLRPMDRPYKLEKCDEFRVKARVPHAPRPGAP